MKNTIVPCSPTHHIYRVHRFLPGLDETAERVVELLQVGEQLRHRGPVAGGSQPADGHDGEELVGTGPRLGQPVAVAQEGHQLEGVDLEVRLLAHRRQLPEEHAERPLRGKDYDQIYGWVELYIMFFMFFHSTKMVR